MFAAVEISVDDSTDASWPCWIFVSFTILFMFIVFMYDRAVMLSAEFVRTVVRSGCDNSSGDAA